MVDKPESLSAAYAVELVTVYLRTPPTDAAAAHENREVEIPYCNCTTRLVVRSRGIILMYCKGYGSSRKVGGRGRKGVAVMNLRIRRQKIYIFR